MAEWKGRVPKGEDLNSTMRILVPTKRVPDPDQRVQVLGHGRGIHDEGIPYIINPFDAIALEEALRIQEGRPGLEVIVVGIGSADYEKPLRTGLAMGADRAIHVACDGSLDPWNVARILAAVVAREQPELVLMGKQAVDDDSNQAGQFLAAILDWPQATFASRIEPEAEALLVTREIDAGMEIVRVQLPAVVTTDLRLNEPRYASLPSIMKARTKPLVRCELSDLGIVLEPKVELISLESTASSRKCQFVADVDELLETIRAKMARG